MSTFSKEQRSVDILEAGQEVTIRSGDVELSCRLRSILSDGDSLRAVLVCRFAQSGELCANTPVVASLARDFDGRSCLYTFESSLLERASQEKDQWVLSITVPRILSRVESRTNFRVSISVGGRFLPQDSSGVAAVSFLTRDFSAGGIRIITHAPLKAGLEGHIHFDTPDTGLLPLHAEVVRCGIFADKQWVSSLRFLDLEPQLENRLFSLVREWEKGLKTLARQRLLLYRPLE